MRLKSISLNSNFRSLKAGFELDFSYNNLDSLEVNPYCIVGKNGSGKSNILELIAYIFYNIELSLLDFKPPAFEELVLLKEDLDFKCFIEENIPYVFKDADIEYLRNNKLVRISPNDDHLKVYINNKESSLKDDLIEVLPSKIYETISSREFPNAYTLEYVINEHDIKIIKKEGNLAEIYIDDTLAKSNQEIKNILPEHIVGYSSGENEIVSLPFFKMRLIQFDEYIDFIEKDELYKYPESRMIYLDNDYSQAIFLCNFLFQNEKTIEVFKEELGISKINSFRIILKQHFLNEFGIDILDHLNKDYKQTEEGFEEVEGVIDKLINCSTTHFLDKKKDLLILDFKVDEEVIEAFQFYFRDKNNEPSALELFKLFQTLILLNQYNVDEEVKNDIYKSESLYLKGKVANVVWNDMIFKFKNFMIEKNDQLILSKSLSDGEHQFLHTIGIALIYKNTSSLFLLDEPETHLNPDWRAKYVSVLKKSFKGDKETPEVLISSHSPFIVSDIKEDNVLIFARDKQGTVSCKKPDFNTFGASVNKITMKVFGKRETIGNVSKDKLERYKQRFSDNEDIDTIIRNMDKELGESIEKILFLKTLLGIEKQVKNPIKLLFFRIKRFIYKVIG